MKSFIFASLFIFSSSIFADVSVSEKETNANSSFSVEQQRVINSSKDQKLDGLDKIREVACKNRELMIIKHASKMP